MLGPLSATRCNVTGNGSKQMSNGAARSRLPCAEQLAAFAANYGDGFPQLVLGPAGEWKPMRACAKCGTRFYRGQARLCASCCRPRKAASELRTCEDCGKSLEANRHGKTKLCMSCSRARLYRPLVRKAMEAVAAAVRRGALRNPRRESVQCTDCGGRATDYDHRDYTRPLDVVPVCRSCNKLRGAGHPYREAAA